MIDMKYLPLTIRIVTVPNEIGLVFQANSLPTEIFCDFSTILSSFKWFIDGLLINKVYRFIFVATMALLNVISYNTNINELISEEKFW